MPPSSELGAVVADWKPTKTSSMMWLGLTGVFGAICLVLAAVGAFSFLTSPMLLCLLSALGWVQLRRSYIAFGDDWLYVRTRLLGGGWTLFDSLESGKVTGKGGTTLLLRGPSFRGRVPVRDATTRRPTTFHAELARRVLARHLKLNAQARFVLHAWAGRVTADAADDQVAG